MGEWGQGVGVQPAATGEGGMGGWVVCTRTTRVQPHLSMHCEASQKPRGALPSQPGLAQTYLEIKSLQGLPG